ncbi:MAG TPA: type IV pilus assembly protein PilM [bacterium]
MAFSLFGKKGVIGVDIGSSSIKVVELREGGKKAYQLMNFGIAPLPSDVVVDGTIMNTSLVAETLKSILGNLRLKTKDAATSVAGTAVLIKKISLPTMTEAELEESIQWEAEQYITNINEVNIDFHILGPGTEEGQMSVLLVGAKKEIINERVNVLVEAGLNPVVVDVDAFAIENSFEINYPAPDPEHLVVLVNVGASVTNINIVKGSASLFTRDISVGGRVFSEEIQKSLRMSSDEAEAMKISLTPETVTPEIDKVLRMTSDNIANEIKKSQDFLGIGGEVKVAGIYLSGGASKTVGLKDVIAEKTGAPVEIMDPFRNVEYNPRVFDPNYLNNISPAASLAFGLGLRKK